MVDSVWGVLGTVLSTVFKVGRSTVKVQWLVGVLVYVLSLIYYGTYILLMDFT